MATVKYGKEVLVTKTEYRANKKVVFYVEDEVKEGETIEQATDRLRKIVDTRIANDIVDYLTGDSRYNETIAKRKRKEMTNAVVSQYGLDFAEFGE
jgi:lauroyl/myristoyl acyltransferase